MKRIIALVLALLMSLSACAFAEEVPAAPQEYATEFVFELTADEPVYVENLLFEEPVTINGDNAQIVFMNCLFLADVTLTAAEGTRVLLLAGTQVGGHCIFDNGVTETTVEASFPKFLTDAPVVAEVRNGCGTLAVLGDFEVMFNGEVYDLAGATVFFDNTNPEQGMVPYEGQEANVYVVCQWIENGEVQFLHECEYAPEE